MYNIMEPPPATASHDDDDDGRWASCARAVRNISSYMFIFIADVRWHAMGMSFVALRCVCVCFMLDDVPVLLEAKL